MNDLTSLKANLERLAAKSTWPEHAEKDGEEFFDASDYSGGNFDDCYNGGVKDGEIYLAREILENLKQAGL